MTLNSLSLENLKLMKSHEPQPVRKYRGAAQLLEMFPYGKV